MEQIPSEIQREILTLLKNQDKLTCLLVSRDWNRLIKPYLFNYTIIRDDQDFSKAITYFEKYPELANTVLYLEIHRCQTVILYLLRIQQLFRNLKNLQCFSSTEMQPVYQPEITFVLGTWDNLKELKIYELYTERNTTMAEVILSSTCPKLTNVCLKAFYGLYEHLPTLAAIRQASIFNSLRNAPQLSQLEITAFYGTLSLLERIHRNAPKLDTLCISDLVVTDDCRLLEPLETVQLDDLWIELDEPTEDQITMFYDYIGKKYTGLESLAITLYYNDPYVFSEYPHAELERKLLPLFARCPQLTTYDQRFFPLTPTIVHEMDRCGIHLDEIDLYIDRQTVESQCVALSNSKQGQFVNHVSLHLSCFRPGPGGDILDISHDARLIRRAVELLANLKSLTNLTIHSIDRLAMHSSNSLAVLSAGINIIHFKEFRGFLTKMPNLSKLSIHGMILAKLRNNYANLFTILSLKAIEIWDLQIESNTHSVKSCMQNLLLSCPDLEEFQLHISHNESLFEHVDRDNDIHDNLDFVILDFSNNLKLKSIKIDSKGDTSQYCIMRFNPITLKHYLHDKANDQWMERGSTITNEYHTIIMLPQQSVLLNSYQI